MSGAAVMDRGAPAREYVRGQRGNPRSRSKRVSCQARPLPSMPPTVNQNPRTPNQEGRRLPLLPGSNPETSSNVPAVNSDVSSMNGVNSPAVVQQSPRHKNTLSNSSETLIDGQGSLNSKSVPPRPPRREGGARVAVVAPMTAPLAQYVAPTNNIPPIPSSAKPQMPPNTHSPRPARQPARHPPTLASIRRSSASLSLDSIPPRPPRSSNGGGITHSSAPADTGSATSSAVVLSDTVPMVSESGSVKTLSDVPARLVSPGLSSQQSFSLLTRKGIITSASPESSKAEPFSYDDPLPATLEEAHAEIRRLRRIITLMKSSGDSGNTIRANPFVPPLTSPPFSPPVSPPTSPVGGRRMIAQTVDPSYDYRARQGTTAVPFTQAPAAKSPMTIDFAPKDDVLQRFNVLSEIVNTEGDYVRDVQFLIKHFYMPISNIISRQELLSIFSNIQVILSVNEEMLASLQSEAELAHVGGMSDFCIGQIFVKMSDFLRLYTSYCNNYNSGMILLAECRKNPAVDEYIQERERDPESKGIDLPGYLIKPVQRVCKYPLLLRELLRCTPAEHDDYENVMSALSSISDVVNQINESKRSNDRTARAAEIVKNIVGLPIDITLIDPSRYLVREGKLDKVAHNKKQERQFFLFSDMLVWCKLTKGGKYQFKGLVALKLCLLSDLRDDVKVKNAFQICRLGETMKSNIILCPDRAIKFAWIEDIQRCVSLELDRHMPAERRGIAALLPEEVSVVADTAVPVQ